MDVASAVNTKCTLTASYTSTSLTASCTSTIVNFAWKKRCLTHGHVFLEGAVDVAYAWCGSSCANTVVVAVILCMF